jgi:glycosyltransferase involved in cell wall biosynthesis
VIRSPHFVDNDHFARGAASADVAAVRRSWAVPDGALVAGFVGKLIPKKRPFDVLEAAAHGGQRNVHVVFVGDGELREACRARAASLAIGATFAGFHNQRSLPAAYAAMDVLVLPSDVRETWGLVVNEAMACGRPALVSRAAGCAPDLVREDRTGYTFELGDVAALGNSLSALASDRALGPRLGAGARAHISNYTERAAVAGVLAAVRAASMERAA